MTTRKADPWSRQSSTPNELLDAPRPTIIEGGNMKDNLDRFLGLAPTHSTSNGTLPRAGRCSLHRGHQEQCSRSNELTDVRPGTRL